MKGTQIKVLPFQPPLPVLFWWLYQFAASAVKREELGAHLLPAWQAVGEPSKLPPHCLLPLSAEQMAARELTTPQRREAGHHRHLEFTALA